jgi:hypothetical protein
MPIFEIFSPTRNLLVLDAGKDFRVDHRERTRRSRRTFFVHRSPPPLYELVLIFKLAINRSFKRRPVFRRALPFFSRGSRFSDSSLAGWST